MGEKSVLDKDCLLISEAAKNIFCSLDFLLDMIEEGKLKAFRVDQSWFTTKAWLNDFSTTMKADILNEIKNQPADLNTANWVATNPIIPAQKPNWLLSLQFVGASLLILMIFGGAVVSYYSTGQLQLIGRVTYQVIQRQGGAINNHKISDEIITDKFYQLVNLGQEFIGNKVGRVAGESSKIND